MQKTKVAALKLSVPERVALVLAVSAALDLRTCRQSFPAVDDKRHLRRLSRRLWSGLVDGAQAGA